MQSNLFVMKFKYLLVSLFLVFGAVSASAQEKKNFELEDLYQRGTFYAKSVRGMNSMKDGKTYASFEKGQDRQIGEDFIRYR